METLLRSQFVFDRVEKTPKPEERKDLTSFAHGAPAELVDCPDCHILVRHERETEPIGAYAADDYDPDVMNRLLPRYVEAFRAREQPYRTLLEAGARVLEIGPHLGAFLQVAREWDWKPEGVDIGKDTTRFIRSQGFTIHNQVLEKCQFPRDAFDAVFIWNCFEQLPDAHATLAEAHRVLKPDGVLVLRTPNALFYRVCQQRLKESPGGDLALWIVRALGYNNLLAFPYLYGYDSDALVGMARGHRFRCEAALNSELITLPFPHLENWVIEENRAAFALVRGWSELERMEEKGKLSGPWIEMIFRANS